MGSLQTLLILKFPSHGEVQRLPDVQSQYCVKQEQSKASGQRLSLFRIARSGVCVLAMLCVVQWQNHRVHMCVGWQKQRSDCFWLEFSLLTFFVSRQRKWEALPIKTHVRCYKCLFHFNPFHSIMTKVKASLVPTREGMQSPLLII